MAAPPPTRDAVAVARGSLPVTAGSGEAERRHRAGTATGQSRAPRSIPPPPSVKGSAFPWHFIFPGTGRFGEIRALARCSHFFILMRGDFPVCFSWFPKTSQNRLLFFPLLCLPLGLRRQGKIQIFFPPFLLGIELGNDPGMYLSDFGVSICPALSRALLFVQILGIPPEGDGRGGGAWL